MKITETVETTKGKPLTLTLDTDTNEVTIETPISFGLPRVAVGALDEAVVRLRATATEHAR
jgi:hypothetical protein